MEVRTRPEGVRASTVQGRAGRSASTDGRPSPGTRSAIGRPLTTSVTGIVVPFMTPRFGTSDDRPNGSAHAVTNTTAETIDAIVPVTRRLPMARSLVPTRPAPSSRMRSVDFDAMTESARLVVRFVTSAKASTDARALANSGWTRIDVIVDSIAILVGLAFVASGQSLGLVLVVLASIALASTRWHPLQRRIIAWRFRGFLGKATVVTIDDEGVRFANEVGTSLIPWAAVTKIRSNDVTTIFVRDRAMLGYIPADAFSTAQARADFIEFARGRLAAGSSDPATAGSKETA